jgi:3' terminal RNA ribose 2'-O-methyltransferase Hen1
MLLTIRTTQSPATDLGYLLEKHPAKLHRFSLSYGEAFVFYPIATEAECQVALLLDVDPVGLVRGRTQCVDGLAQYVNDRPYAASSFLSVAIAQVFRSALTGKSRERPDLAEQAIPLEATVESMPCRGGEHFLRRLFEPLGYQVSAERIVLDDAFPEWGESRYFTVRLAGNVRLRDFLTHLYVLIPVLDDDKHYWVGDDEVEKLVAKGEGWLSEHPEKDQIALRYLKHRRYLTQTALSQLPSENGGDKAEGEDELARPEEHAEAPLSLNEQRLQAVIALLKESGARRVIDLGCGDGKLLQRLLRDKSIAHVAGVDVSPRALERSSTRRSDARAVAVAPDLVSRVSHLSR